MTNEEKRKSEVTPATNRSRKGESRNNQSPEKGKTGQQKHLIGERMRRNNQSPEIQKTERETHAIQRKKQQNSCKKTRGRIKSHKKEKQGTNGQREESQEKDHFKKNTDKDVKELLSDETISKAIAKVLAFLH